ncbi:MAG: Apolipoprotein N-acyltransferase [Chlamydiae bacterium]|nr:Apolipoprotein N-acyltransferase [Chlamydiota bacterium]
MLKSFYQCTLSFIVCAFGLVYINGFLALLAACFGYGLFFSYVRAFSTKKKFWIATSWFFCVQLVHLFWLTNPTYCGLVIWFGYLFYASILAIPFGLAVLLIPKQLNRSDLVLLPLAFVLVEAVRSLYFYGLPWSSFNLHLSFTFPMQLASYFGAYFLTYLVFLNNFLFLFAIEKKSNNRWINFAFVAILPFLFGFAHIKAFENFKTNKGLDVVLIQPMLSTAEPLFGGVPKNLNQVETPYQNIQHFVGVLPEKTDVLLFPEGSFLTSLHSFAYRLDEIKALLEPLSENIAQFFPKLEAPYGVHVQENVYVNNAFILQTFANFYDADVICSIDDRVSLYDTKWANCAIFFQKDKPYERYLKQKLVPITEYIPFEWTRKIASFWGINMECIPGKHSSVFLGKANYGTSICYEKGFSSIQRAFRNGGANLFVNLSNEMWFPNTTLAKEDLIFAKYRAIENGITFLNVCNSSQTAVIDRFGRVQNQIDPLLENNKTPKILESFVALEMHPTLYTKIGDVPLLTLSILSLIITCVQRLWQHRRKEKRA